MVAADDHLLPMALCLSEPRVPNDSTLPYNDMYLS
jgi:hypothetical protein